jgi:hypothetical protein
VRRAGEGPARLRAALVVAAVIVGVALLGRGLDGGSAEAVVLDVPPAGQTLSAELPDGTPVFVSHEPDGDVHVVEAVNPHRSHGLQTLVGWCPEAGGFEDAVDGSRFDASGRWLFGPAQRGLATFDGTAGTGAVLVGARRAGRPRSTVADPAVRQWCSPGNGLDARAMVTHAADATADLLGVPGQAMLWCDGVRDTDPPRCAETVAVLAGAEAEGPLPWGWKGPVRRDAADPGSVQLLPGGKEEVPAVGTLTRVFGEVRRLSTVAGTLRLVVNRKIVFSDFFTVARPLELGEPVPRLWKLGDHDGPILLTYVLTGSSETEARALVGELIDMVVANGRTILDATPVPRS